MASSPEEAWRAAWAAEIDRRQQRLETGDDRELTLEEFFSDDDLDPDLQKM
jgi:hypothetical protein